MNENYDGAWLNMKKEHDRIGPKRLIVNADDFGLTEGISRGIVDGFKTGIITSTSLLATMPSFEHAVQLALEHDLDVGVHVSLTAGRPCSKDNRLAPLLRNGEFIRSWPHLFRTICRGKIDRSELKREMAAQITKIRKSGLEISHMDGHQHILMFPRLFEPALELMGEHDIPYFRIPAETVTLSGFRSSKGWGFQALGLLSKYWKSRIRRVKRSVGLVDHFVGLSFSEKMSSKNLMRTMASLRPGISELMCHPGSDDAAYHMIYEKPFPGERELGALKNAEVIEFIKMNQIELTAFRDLSATRS